MTAEPNLERLIQVFLQEGPRTLPTRSYDAVRAQIDQTRQRVVLGPWREEQMTAFAKLAIGAAAVMLIAVVGIRFLPTDSFVGLQPSPTPTAAPTGTPTPSPPAEVTPISDPEGRLQPGTYSAHPFVNDTTSFTFNIETNHWESLSLPGQMSGIAWVGDSGTESSGGVGMGFLHVDSLNGDACHWSGTGDDIALGPHSDELVRALQEPTTNFEVTDGPMPANTANVTGQDLVLTMPADLNDAACDNGAYRIWNAEGFDIYAQGPSNVWTVSSFSINPNSADRVVILQSTMPDTPVTVLNELRQIVSSVRIELGVVQATPTPTSAPTPSSTAAPVSTSVASR